MRLVHFALALVLVFVSARAEASPTRSAIGGRSSILTNSEPDEYTAKDYIQEGLVALWDGIENVGWGIHDSDSDVWVDLIGGSIMKLCVFGEDFNIPSGTSMSPYSYVITRDFTLHGRMTLPPLQWYNWTVMGIGVGSAIQNGITWSAMNSPRDGICYRKAYSGTILARVNPGLQAGKTYSVDILFAYDSKAFHVFVDGTYVDGAQIAEEDWNLEGVKCAIGTTFLRFTDIGDFKRYNILFYNRMLSEAEIAYNYELDLRRFGNDN